MFGQALQLLDPAATAPQPVRTHAACVVGLAWCRLLRRGEHRPDAEDVRNFGRAVQTFPGYAEAWVGLGMALAETGHVGARHGPALIAVSARATRPAMPRVSFPLRTRERGSAHRPTWCCNRSTA